MALSPQASAEERKAHAESQRERRAAYDALAKDFARVLVFVSTPLGLAAIFIGAFLASSAIGSGLIFGGILTVTHGYWAYWNYISDMLRFVSLLLGFAVLLFVAYSRAGGLRRHAASS